MLPVRWGGGCVVPVERAHALPTIMRAARVECRQQNGRQRDSYYLITSLRSTTTRHSISHQPPTPPVGILECQANSVRDIVVFINIIVESFVLEFQPFLV
jgi:hypothetical protein